MRTHRRPRGRAFCRVLSGRSVAGHTVYFPSSVLARHPSIDWAHPLRLLPQTTRIPTGAVIAPRRFASALLRLSWALRLTKACLASLIAFCVLLGTPLVATETARVALSWLGCEVDPWRSPPACLEWSGFWIPRLRDYVDGWFTAPYLLVLHFGWLILAWAGIRALLFGLTRLVRWRELGE